MIGTIIFDQDNRTFRLLKTRLKKVEGTRFATRDSIKKVLLGQQDFVRAGSSHPKARSQWHAVANRFKLRIGCRVFRGADYQNIRAWALGN